MTAIPQWICFHGQAVPVGTAFGPLAVTGSGFVHVTSSVIDGAANTGTAGQYALTNAAGTDTSWVAMSGDSTSSTSTPGKVTNTGLQGISVPAPSGTSTVLTYNAGAYTWSPAVTAWADDLAGSTNSAQYVAALTGSGGTPGAIPLNASSWISQTAGNIFLKTGTSTVLSVDGSSNTVLNAPSGSGVVIELNGATTVAQLSASASDYAAFGASPATSGWLRTGSPPQVLWSIAASGVNYPAIQFDAGANLLLGLSQSASASTNGSQSALFGQSATTSTNNGGSVAVASGGNGGGTGNVGSVQFQFGGVGASTQVQFVGTAANAPAAFGNLQWSSTITPQLTQANAASNVLATAFSISAQNANPGSTGTANISGGSIVLTPGAPATANGSSGSVSVVLSAPTGTAKEGFLSLTRGANVEMLLGASPGDTTAAIWMGTSQTANANSTNFTVATFENGSQVSLNSPSATGTVKFTNMGSPLASANTTFWSFNLPVGGATSVPYQYANTTQALSVGSTNTLTTPSCPIQAFTGAITGTSTIVSLPYPYRTRYTMDFTACTGLGSNTISVQANTSTKAITVSAPNVYDIYTDGTAKCWALTYS